ncbi:VanW family protein [Caloramator proteoclasticus]|uniref:Vancomycin resistance protein YoaR, contains peptidoglycan-binding and VanW domains n=1 Tax=Caloramator proteoclasticus DSM 10124 TaxID=1121262 RepID=A0A1M4W9K1_9CLOT|nr:VanW family protein [Caloramator proteoclasticus]SHE77941.1 Vancomycin resistance protein YoaR, contains peptidoglycan-binding and VanW domains [Caloramator proteoclasticus DSM 10124]
MKKGLRNGLIIFFSLTILFIVSSVIFLLNSTNKASNKIFEGIYINNEYVGGMTKEEANKLLNEKFNSKIQNRKIDMFYGDKKYSIDFKRLKAHYDIEKAVEEAYSYGKTGNIIEKTIQRYNLKRNPYNIPLNFVSDTTILEGEVKKIAKDINKEPIDAKISRISGKFIITPEKSGIAVDEPKLIEFIKNEIKPEGEIEKIEVPTKVVEAKIKAEALSNITTKISSFTTSFKPSDVNRTGNIKIAAKYLTGTVIMPGDVFSMIKVLGPRNENQGYKEAPVIINGKLEPGLAGGICQVSTTMYNAALLGNFEIVKRRPHGLAVAYVAPGRDATIAGDSIDFQFKNNYNNPIYIEAVVETSTITINIYGANERIGQSVEIVSEVYERTEPKVEYINDPNLPEGQKVVEIKPIAGMKVRTYRKIYQNGKLIKTEKLGDDTYKVLNGKIRVGTKKVIQNTQTQNDTINEQPINSEEVDNVN